MNLTTVMDLRKQLTDLASDIFVEKNKEYATDQDRDALGNFHKAAAEYKVHPQLVLGVFMDKHLASIRAHIASRAAGETPKSSEPFPRRIADAINYLHFLYALETEHLQSLETTGSGVYVGLHRAEFSPVTFHNVGADDV